MGNFYGKLLLLVYLYSFSDRVVAYHSEAESFDKWQNFKENYISLSRKQIDFCRIDIYSRAL